MKQQYALALALSLGILGFNVQAEDKDSKPATIKAIMKVHAKGNLRMKATDAVKAESWDKAGPLVKEWAKLAGDLAKNTPKKGEKDSWEAECKKYVACISTIEKAVAAKDQKAAAKALGAVGGTCGSCHKAHK